MNVSSPDSRVMSQLLPCTYSIVIYHLALIDETIHHRSLVNNSSLET
jgi:hypothetical protein